MYIPQVNDLLSAAQQSNGSASMNPGDNPVNDFIQTLAKYASPVVKPVVNEAKALPGQAMSAVNTVGKAIGDQPLINNPIPFSKPVGPTLSQAADAVNENVAGGQLPGPELLHGKATPMTLLGLAMMGEGGLENPEDTTKTAEDTAGKAEEGLPSIGEEVAPKAPPAGKSSSSDLPGGNPKDIPSNAIAMMDAQYTVPAKRAMGDIQKMDTYKGILAHVRSGMSPDVMEQAPALVSDGTTGLIPKMTREVVGNMGESVPLDTQGIQNAASNVMDNHKLFISDEAKDAVLNDINRAKPAGGIVGDQADPSDVLQYVRELEGMARETRQGDNYLTMRGDKRYIAQAFDAAADQAMESLDNHPDVGKLMAAVKTPERMAYLKNISPRLAQQVENAKNPSELRSSIRDFVNFSKILDQTDASSGSVFGKVGKQMLEQSRSEDAANTAGNIIKGITHPRDALTAATKGAVKKLVQPFDETPQEKLINAVNENNPPGGGSGGPPSGNGGKANPGGGKTMKTIAGIATLGTVAAGSAALDHAINGANAQSKNSTNNSDNNHKGLTALNSNDQPFVDSLNFGNTTVTPNTSPVKPINYNDLPTDSTQVTADTALTPPTMIKDKSGNPLAMVKTDNTDEELRIQNELKTPAAITSDYISSPLKSRLAQLQAIDAQSSPIMGKYNDAANTDNAIETSVALLKDAPTGLFNENGLVSNYNTLFQGKFANLQEQLDILGKFYPTLTKAVLSAPDKNTAKGILNQIKTRVKQDYVQYINTQTGNLPGNSNEQTPPAAESSVQSSPFTPTATGLPAIQNEFHGLPTNPLLQQ